MSNPSQAGPARVTEPVLHALDVLIIVTAASFGLSILAVVVTLLAVDEPLHSFGHVALPALMGLVVIVHLVRMLLHRAQPGNDAWARARAVSTFDARLAEVLSVAVPTAWLIGSAAILYRHASDFHSLAGVIGIWLPLAAALWICATFAWTDGCRDRIAAGLDESDRRFREYWRDVARRPTP